MARTARHLGVAELIGITKHGRHSCGRQLYMEVSSTGRAWLVRYTYQGKPTWMGFGKVDTGRWAESLHAARQKAQEALDALARGEDPRELKRPSAARSGDSRRVTFWACAEEYLNTQGARWRNERYAAQSEATLRAWTATLARRPVDSITVSDVKDCLAPHWRRIPVTADRVRQHIAAVFELAIGHEWRTAANPATAKVMRHVLGSTQREKEHMAALPWADVPALMSKLKAMDSPASRALQFAILTCARTAEAIGARWPEIDLERKTWTIPKGRMKRNRAHRVPLSGAALAVLAKCTREEGEPLVFPHLGRTALYKLLTRDCGLEPGTVTVHGMRSAFADWCADTKACSPAVADAALAHVIKNPTTRAYLRTDYFDERVNVMNSWALFVG